jgi:predicted RNA-binding protein with PIN domain
MALVRILVDGFSLLHNWQQLAAGKPRHSEAARDELVRMLTQYSDATGVPITVIFDGGGAPPGVPDPPPPTNVEIVFSRAGRTADDLIERVTHRLRPYGEVLVVTDDVAERDIVIGLGGLASSCANFIHSVLDSLKELQSDLKHYNLRERNRFRSTVRHPASADGRRKQKTTRNPGAAGP